jgi:hypothetical protein
VAQASTGAQVGPAAQRIDPRIGRRRITRRFGARRGFVGLTAECLEIKAPDEKAEQTVVHGEVAESHGNEQQGRVDFEKLIT